MGVILTHEWDGAIQGFDAFPRADWSVAIVTFFAFRIMVGLGFLMFAIGLWSPMAAFPALPLREAGFI